MFIVYILISQQNPLKYYIGFTENFDQRLAEHNSGNSLYSKRYAPWKLASFITFQDKSKALAFEKYLKAGSGHAFLKWHLI